MRVLIIHQRGVPVDLPWLESMMVTKNTTPPGEGVAIYEMGREPDWSWPEYTITVGEVDIGRHEKDAHIEIAGDINAQIRQIIDSITAEFVDDEEEDM